MPAAGSRRWLSASFGHASALLPAAISSSAFREERFARRGVAGAPARATRGHATARSGRGGGQRQESSSTSMSRFAAREASLAGSEQGPRGRRGCSRSGRAVRDRLRGAAASQVCSRPRPRRCRDARLRGAPARTEQRREVPARPGAGGLRPAAASPSAPAAPEPRAGSRASCGRPPRRPARPRSARPRRRRRTSSCFAPACCRSARRYRSFRRCSVGSRRRGHAIGLLARLPLEMPPESARCVRRRSCPPRTRTARSAGASSATDGQPAVDVLLEAAQHHGLELPRDRGVNLAQRRRRVDRDLGRRARHVLGRRTACSPGEQLVEDDAERPDVGARVDVLASFASARATCRAASP